MKKKKVLLTRDVCGHIQRGCRTKPFGGGCAYGELVRDPRVELREEVVCGVGGQGHHQAWPLEGNGGVKRAKTTVTDLLEKKKQTLIDNCSTLTRKPNCFLPAFFIRKQHLILDDDAIGFRWLFPVKENSVLKRGGSQ